MLRFPILLVCLIASASAARSGSVPVSEREAKAWLQYAVPLPKSVRISAKVTVPLKDVGLTVESDSGPVIDQACKELRGILGPASGSAFRITLQVGGRGSESLSQLKNSAQAYLITAEEDTGLRLVGLSPTGVYYAAKTLQQLLKPAVKGDRVEIPLLEVTDWPDLEARGTWGADNYDILKWMGDRKLNFVEQISAIGVDENGKGWAKHKDDREPLSTEAYLYGMMAVPVVLHLDQVSDKGLFAAYPNLEAKGGQKGAICYSQPQIVDVIADWIVDLASLPNVAGVDVWMAENLHGQGGCRCDECAKTDRSVLEARVIVKAWKKAEQRLGRKIPLYVLSSEETYKSNSLVLAELPPEIRFWFYWWLTYNTGETPLIPANLAEAAAQGRWIGVVPNLDSMTHFCQPFTGADFVHYRMNEFVDKKLSGLLGYITPRHLFFRFNLEAAAEWSWNAKGRTPQEFALSWAIRQGLPKPERWARWASLIGPVEWDIYGSEWPSGTQRSKPGQISKLLLDGKLPELGSVLHDAFRLPFGDIKSVEQLDADVAAASRALRLARIMAIPEYLHESLIADGYIRSLKALYELKQLVRNRKIAEPDRPRAIAQFSEFDKGLRQAADSLPEWAKIMDPKVGAGWVERQVRVINRLRTDMADAARELGF